jgi:hypothetical protein
MYRMVLLADYMEGPWMLQSRSGTAAFLIFVVLAGVRRMIEILQFVDINLALLKSYECFGILFLKH